MSWTTDSHQDLVGAEVFGADGDKVGTVSEVYPGYIVVEKGFFFPTDYYIPASAIASASAGQVYLTTTRDAALNSGWDTVPDVQTTASAATLGTAAATTDTWTDTDRIAAARVSGDEEIRIPVMEEELTATVRQQEAGAVRIEKDVISEERTLEVPVTEERIRVERRAATDRDGRGPEAGPGGRRGRGQQGRRAAHRARHRHRAAGRGLRRRGCC